MLAACHHAERTVFKLIFLLIGSFMADYCWNLTAAVSTPSHHLLIPDELGSVFSPLEERFPPNLPFSYFCLDFKELQSITHFF